MRRWNPRWTGQTSGQEGREGILEREKIRINASPVEINVSTYLHIIIRKGSFIQNRDSYHAVTITAIFNFLSMIYSVTHLWSHPTAPACWPGCADIRSWLRRKSRHTSEKSRHAATFSLGRLSTRWGDRDRKRTKGKRDPVGITFVSCRCLFVAMLTK